MHEKKLLVCACTLAGAGNNAQQLYAELQAGLNMECWACGLLTAGSDSLHDLGVKHVSSICQGGWGFTLLRVEGGWEVYGRQACLSAGIDTHPILSRRTP